MPSFFTESTSQNTLADGTYVFKIADAKERISENGNPMIVMRLETPDGKSVQCIITFVERAKRLINCFCESAQLIRPPDEGAQVELTAAVCRGRYIYATVVNEAGAPDDDPTPRVSRFLSRELAIAKNPKLAEIVLPPQKPVALVVLQPSPTGGAR